jgi:hypothetical protein
MLEAHKLRMERDDDNIALVHLADAIERLVTRSRPTLSDDRSPKDPYRRGGDVAGAKESLGERRAQLMAAKVPLPTRAAVTCAQRRPW